MRLCVYYSRAASDKLLVSQFQLYLLEIEFLNITQFIKNSWKFAVKKGKICLLECHLIERQ